MEQGFYNRILHLKPSYLRNAIDQRLVLARKINDRTVCMRNYFKVEIIGNLISIQNTTNSKSLDYINVT